MTCLSITQWSLSNFYSLQGLFFFRFSGGHGMLGRRRFIECLRGGQQKTPHIDSSSIRSQGLHYYSACIISLVQVKQ